MIIRSWLFVPGDSERKMEKARDNPADALIVDLEDSVSNDRQTVAREMSCAYLTERADRSKQQLWVRINPLDTDLSLPDLAAVMPGRPDGICLPKVYSAKDVNTLCNYLSPASKAPSWRWSAIRRRSPPMGDTVGVLVHRWRPRRRAGPARLSGWVPQLASGGVLAIHDVFPDPADGGRPPYEEIYLPAMASGDFDEERVVGSLRVLRRR